MTVDQIIQKLKLQPHPEGGYYRETYRSSEIIPKSVLGTSYSGNRNVSTAIYFLLTSENFSAFHRVNQDEIWHFHLGSTVNIHLISPTGEYQKVSVGNDILKDNHPQFCVPAKSWFAAEVDSANSFCLVSCTVAPGFDFDDFSLAKREELVNLFPKHQEVIFKFTRS